MHGIQVEIKQQDVFHQDSLMLFLTKLEKKSSSGNNKIKTPVR